MNKSLTITEFHSLIKGIEAINENGICSISSDRNNIELIFNFDLDTEEFELESFGNYKTDECYSLSYAQETVLKNMIEMVVVADSERFEKEYELGRIEYVRGRYDGYGYAI